jgi:hypothetical protein
MPWWGWLLVAIAGTLAGGFIGFYAAVGWLAWMISRSL